MHIHTVQSCKDDYGICEYMARSGVETGFNELLVGG